MASVYQRPHSPYWMARFRTPDGKWTAKSTKQRNRTKALEVAHLWESGGKMILLESPQDVQFERVLRGLYEQMTGRRMEPNPAADWLRGWVASQSAQKKAKTGARYAKVVDDFIAHLGTEAGLDIRTVSQAKVQGFLDRERLAGKSGSTVTLNAKILRAAFNHAMRSGIIERNPAGAVTLPAAAHRSRGVFTNAEIAALLAAARGTDWETAIMLGKTLGLRLGDAANLTWDNVDLAAAVVRYMPEKTSRKGKTLAPPMTSELQAYLESLASSDRAQRAKHLCPTLAGRQVGGRAGLSAEFMALMARANVDAGRVESTGGEGRAFSAKSFHSLRHKVASDLANTGAPEKVAREVLGHASAAQTDRYTHLEQQTMRRALEKVQRRNERANRT